MREIPDYEPCKSILTEFYQYDEPHNLVPSLHIAYSTTVFLYLWKKSVGHWRTAFIIWTVAIYASVVLTHQHHIIDIVTGAALSLCVYKLIETYSVRLSHLFNAPEGA